MITENKLNKKAIITTTMLNCFQTSVRNGHITQDRMVELLNEKALEFAIKYAEECVKASLEKASEQPSFYKLNDSCERVYGIKKELINKSENIVLL